MGRITPNNNFEFTEKYIIDVLNNHFFSKNSVKYLLNNLYVFNWESDYLAFTKSGLCYEIEVKISKADFKKDFEKKDKHLLLESTFKNDLDNNSSKLLPNYFYYAVPENLISVSEIPDYAGLLYINNNVFPYFKRVKDAPKLLNDKLNLLELNLTDKFYYNMWNWKNNAEKNYLNIIDKLKKQVSDEKTDIDGKKYKYTLSEANKRIDLLNDEISLKEKYIEQYYNDYNELRRENRKLKKLLFDNNIKYDL